MTEETQCPAFCSPNGGHCEHWYDGDTCGYCGAGPLDNATRADQGMEPYDPNNDPHSKIREAIKR